jgi:hypothetical protein
MAIRDPVPPIEPDDGVDVTLIRWMLALSPEERLAVLQGFVDSIVELTFGLAYFEPHTQSSRASRTARGEAISPVGARGSSRGGA